MTTLERIWFAYLAAVLGVALFADGGGDPGHLPRAFIAVHVAIAAAQVGIAVVHRRFSPRAARWLRGAFAPIACTTTFAALAMLLPAVHPEPYEYAWLAVDVHLFGGDLTQPAFASLGDGAVLVLQLAYASFYALPVLGSMACAAISGPAAFDRAMTILVGSFLVSYLGYLLFPTLGPGVVYAHAGEPTTGLAAVVHRAIDRAEPNPWDCFPSGHTMLSLTSVLVVWRWARRLVLPFLLLAVTLVASTVLLRYHWPIDVVAGALLCWPVARGIDALLDRDGAAPVPRPVT